MLVGPTSLLAQQPTERIEIGTGTDIHARIEMHRSTYSLGDTACVRVTLVNTSDRRVGYTERGTADMVHLVVKRNGQVVHPNVEPAGSASASIANFQPRAAWPLADGQWVPITFWGYRLEEPGQYTIVGIPQIWSGYRETKPDTTTVRSNEVAFTVKAQSVAHASCNVANVEVHKPRRAEAKARADSVLEATRAKMGGVVQAKMEEDAKRKQGTTDK
jgi:hypothetical protein